MHTLKKVPTSIVIQRVANGFIIEMPKPYDCGPSDLGDITGAMMQSALPVFKEMMRMKDEDPLLSRLQGEDEPPPPAEKSEELEAVGVDPHVHVFATWDGVLDFLTNLMF